MDKLAAFNLKNASPNKFSGIQTGWTIKVWQKLREGDKAKSQMFDGIVIARKHGEGSTGTITVRKMFGGIGVEKVYPIRLPSIEKVEVVKRARVRRSKLYYLRRKSAKEIRKKTRQESLTKTPDTIQEESSE
jgi:large subunit ribosomal protein L19